jgi:hypothetical protein
MAIWDEQFGGGLPQLAPDLTYPSTLSGNLGFARVTGINAVGSLTTALSLSGRFSVSLLQFENITGEPVTVKLTIDSVVVWNDTFTASSSIRILGSRNTDGTDVPETISCNSSFLLEIQTTADPSVGLAYLARPIL